MSGQDPSAWDHMLSQRLRRESGRTPPPEGQGGAAGTHGGTSLFDPSALARSSDSSERITVGWPVAQPPAHWPKAIGPRTEPSLVVEQLRRLSPQEERRAYEILRGRRPRGRAIAVLVVSATAAALAAGTVLALSRGLFGERSLLLAMDVAPPEEGPPPAEAAGRGRSPEAATAASGPVGLVEQEGPTYVLRIRPGRTAWVEIQGPGIDLSGAPPVAERHTPAPREAGR